MKKRCLGIFLLTMSLTFSCSIKEKGDYYEDYASYRAGGGDLSYFEWLEANRPKTTRSDEGVSISSTYINEQGHLIIVLSNGQTYDAGINKGLAKTKYSVNFYCDDTLIRSEKIPFGTKIKKPSFDGITVKTWFLDKEKKKEWNFSSMYVNKETNLYASYEAKGAAITFIDDKFNHFLPQKHFILGKAYELPSLVDRSSKYRFLGWENEEKIIEQKGIWKKATSVTLVAKWKEKEPFEIDYFGIYPQSVETDPSTIATLNSLAAVEDTAKKVSYISYYEWGGIWYRKRRCRTKSEERVLKKFDKPRYYEDGVTPAIGGTNYYFRFEPVKWILIPMKNGDYIALTEKVLDIHYYRYSDGPNNDYKESYVRSWLISSDKFSYHNGLGLLGSDFWLNEKEQSLLEPYANANGDKFFLLSSSEVKEYLTKEQRKADLTDFVTCYRELEPSRKAIWATRSKGSDISKILAISQEGEEIDWDNDRNSPKKGIMDGGYFGVRFAVKLNKKRLKEIQKRNGDLKL